MASKVSKMVDGKPEGGSPCINSMKEFFAKIDADPEWFPGKHSDATRGPKRVLRGIKVTATCEAMGSEAPPSKILERSGRICDVHVQPRFGRFSLF